ncbi:TPA: UDP-glucose 4-epimerase GalE, partial [Escherichia coli]|nr:UDP-glucose 4-epimerase GalE [Escherichia coli]
ITGGTGYIGSHTVATLLKKGESIVVIDNLINSSDKVLARIKEIAKLDFVFFNADVLNLSFLKDIISRYKIDTIIHFAALKSVSESNVKPIEYYTTNVVGTLNILQAMTDCDVKNLIFSSSATVYGEPVTVPITEKDRIGGTTNPYGSSKFFSEVIIHDYANVRKDKNIICLRYFNPVGAHSSGLIGEDPKGIPSNLFPYISQVAVSKLEFLNVYGGDYPTRDGSGVRDYIHVMDLAEGHYSALKFLNDNSGYHCFNLGTGRGYSVFEVIKKFEEVTQKKIPFKVMPRRPGDIAECWSSPEKANSALGWIAQRGLTEMVQDAWRWQSLNPNGFI